MIFHCTYSIAKKNIWECYFQNIMEDEEKDPIAVIVV